MIKKDKIMVSVLEHSLYHSPIFTYTDIKPYFKNEVTDTYAGQILKKMSDEGILDFHKRENGRREYTLKSKYVGKNIFELFNKFKRVIV